MILTILQAIYFMLPAYVANMAPVIFKLVPLGGFPIHEKWFGAHKTWRGIFAGVFAALVTVFLQREVFEFSFFKNISILFYPHLTLSILVSLGLAFGLGALSGDLLKSFVKRRLSIPSGKPWVPFDQLDFVIGALLAVSPLFSPSLTHIVIIVIATPLLHLATNSIAYLLGLKKVWW